MKQKDWEKLRRNRRATQERNRRGINPRLAMLQSSYESYDGDLEEYFDYSSRRQQNLGLIRLGVILGTFAGLAIPAAIFGVIYFF